MNAFLDGLEIFGLYVPAHSRYAQDFIARRYPDHKLVETLTLAREGDRDVVAVFYEHADGVSFPIPYRLCAVSADCTRVEELPTTPESPYWIRGRK